MRQKIGLGGPKKELNAELNLTSFIDLLSTCVCFLLITAVWIEVGTIEIKQKSGTQAAATEKESFDLDLVFLSPQKINLTLKRNNRRVKTVKVEAESYDDVITSLKDKLQNELLIYKEKAVKIAAATVTPRSTVEYGKLIKALDTLREYEIVNIGVLTTSK